MSVIDFDSLMQDVDGDAACGPDLEYDPDFVALELDVIGKPEVQYGDTITAAVPPDWKAIDRSARALLLRSHDLRLAIHLARSSLALHGMPGFAGGLRLIERMLDEHWEGVHPQLDADDDMDPTLRLNSLVILTDHTTVIKELKEASLIQLPGLGKLTLRMLEIATGELAAPEGTEKIAISSIEMALRDAGDATLAAARDAVTQAYDSAARIEKLLESHVGVAQSLSLDSLIRLLKRGRDFLGTGAADAAGDEQQAADATGDDAGASAGGIEGGGRRAAPISGEIANRADVVRMLDKLIAYYEQHEPSSPLPILLERAKRLVPKNFMEILEDLAPDGMLQANVFRGQQDAPAEY